MHEGGDCGLSEAVLLAKTDLGAARRSAAAARRKAPRRGEREIAAACLGAMRLFATWAEDRLAELRLARKAVKERGNWLDLIALAQVYVQRSQFADARSLYGRALEKCVDDDVARTLVTAALSRLSPAERAGG